MIWPGLMALAAAVTIVAAATRRADLACSAAAILGAYIAGRLIKAGIQPEMQTAAFAALWVSVGGFVASYRALKIPALLTVAAGMCYLWARLTSAPWVIGSPPFVASDICAVLALAWIGWMSRDALGRGDHLGGYRRGRGVYRRAADHRR